MTKTTEFDGRYLGALVRNFLTSSSWISIISLVFQTMIFSYSFFYYLLTLIVWMQGKMCYVVNKPCEYLQRSLPYSLEVSNSRCLLAGGWRLFLWFQLKRSPSTRKYTSRYYIVNFFADAIAKRYELHFKPYNLPASTV